MAFLKKKTPESKPVKARSLQELARDRVLTAEGWRRRVLKKVKKAK